MSHTLIYNGQSFPGIPDNNDPPGWGSAVTNYLNALSTGSITYSVLQGVAAGKVMAADGSGNLVFIDAPAPGFPLTAGNGSATIPQYTFAAYQTTGMYAPAANSLGFSTNGILALKLDASQNATITGNLTVSGTSATLPAITTSAITATNITSSGTDSLGATSVTTFSASSTGSFTGDLTLGANLNLSANQTINIGSNTSITADTSTAITVKAPSYVLENTAGSTTFLALSSSGVLSVPASALIGASGASGTGNVLTVQSANAKDALAVRGSSSNYLTFQPEVTTNTANIGYTNGTSYQTLYLNNLSGVVEAATPSSSDNSNKVATTAFVKTALGNDVATVKYQYFTGNGTYTPSTGLLFAYAYLIGSGGSGASTGAAGGSGAYIFAKLTPTDIGTSLAVEAGLANHASLLNSTSGNSLQANAGANGSGTTGGAGGTIASSTLGTVIDSRAGQQGGNGETFTISATTYQFNGMGGCVPGWGQGGLSSIVTTLAGSGRNGVGYGAGGSGGGSGTAASPAVVVIVEYCNQ